MVYCLSRTKEKKKSKNGGSVRGPVVQRVDKTIPTREKLLYVNFCKDHRNKIEVPDPLAVEDLISSKFNNKQKLARLITQYRDIFFPIFRKAWPSFFRVLQGVTFSVTP